MKNRLRQIEKYLQRIVEESTDWILGSTRVEKLLVQELIAAMDTQIRVDSEKNILAPNIFSLNVPSKFINEIRSNQSLIENLENNLAQAGENAGIHFTSPITINIFPDQSLDAGEFKILAIWKDDSISNTHPMEPKRSTTELVAASILPKAFLIVEGTQIFTIEQDIINIGRQTDNNLVLSDIRISRKHAQIRVVKGRHMIFDLESSGGTFVNNKRISQITLHPGDVISLSGVPLVYGQDAYTHLDETKEYNPSPQNSSDSTTTININHLKTNKK